MAEDYTTWNPGETDPNTRITVIASKVSWAALTRNEDAYHLDDKGADHFGVDFEHKVKVYLDSADTADSYVSCWALADYIDDILGLDASGYDILDVRIGGSAGAIYLNEVVAGTRYFDGNTSIVLDTLYYLRIKRDSGVGSYGTLYCYIATGNYDDDGGTPVDTLTLTLHNPSTYQNGDALFKYIYAVTTLNAIDATSGQDGYCENLDLQEAVGWTGKISGVTNPAKIMGVAVASISKVKGVS